MNGFELNYSQVFTKTLHNPNNRGYHNIVSVPLQYLEEDNPNQHEQIATIVTDKPKDRKCHDGSFSTSSSPDKDSKR